MQLHPCDSADTRRIFHINFENTPLEGTHIEQWLSVYGVRIDLEKQYALAYTHNHQWPTNKVIVVCSGPEIPSNVGWVILSRNTFSNLWCLHRRKPRGIMSKWYWVDRLTILPFTDAPVF